MLNRSLCLQLGLLCALVGAMGRCRMIDGGPSCRRQFFLCMTYMVAAFFLFHIDIGIQFSVDESLSIWQ